jgi:hypothetical protein
MPAVTTPGYGLGAWGVDSYGDPLYGNVVVQPFAPTVEGDSQTDPVTLGDVDVGGLPLSVERDPGPDTDPVSLSRRDSKRVSLLMPAPTLTDGRPTA